MDRNASQTIRNRCLVITLVSLALRRAGDGREIRPKAGAVGTEQRALRVGARTTAGEASTEDVIAEDCMAILLVRNGRGRENECAERNLCEPLVGKGNVQAVPRRRPPPR